MIHFAVEEAVSAGLTDIIIVINQNKSIIEDYFDSERVSGNSRIDDLLKRCKIHFVYQNNPIGLADAIDRSREIINGEPFAVLLPDNFYVGEGNPTLDLIEIYSRYKRDISALIWVNDNREASGFGNCGRVELDRMEDKIFIIKKLFGKEPGVFSLRGNRPEIRTFARIIFNFHVFDNTDYWLLQL
jgi:UTP--glucose-1-phosphate uridylyltransferase